MNQELIDRAEKTFAVLRSQLEELESGTCALAAGDKCEADANEDFTEALGYLMLAKASATRGARRKPGFSPKFGGK